MIIEDDKIEIMKLYRAVSSLELNHNIIEAKSGEEALFLLQKKDKLPHIILLDLNMPKVNGIELLSALKKDNQLQHIPTIILTTSNNLTDLLECYKIGIAGYILKPLKYKTYVSKIEKLLNYWSINELI